MDDPLRRMIRELELMQTIGHLLQKAGEVDAQVTLNGWALEGAGSKIVNSCQMTWVVRRGWNPPA